MSILKSALLLGTILSAAAISPAVAQSASPYTSYTRFDALGRVTGTISADPDGSGPLPHLAVRNSYDAGGQLTMIEHGRLAAFQSEAVAPANWTGFVVDRIADTVYDAGGRKLRESVRANGTVYSLTQYSYDPLGRLDCTAVRMNQAAFNAIPASACTLGSPGGDGPDRITRTVYDRAGQVVQVRTRVGLVGPDNTGEAEITNSYTDNGQRRFVIDGNGNRAELRYDGHDRLARWVFPSATPSAAYVDSSQATALASAGALNEADNEQYGYDPNGNRTSVRTRAGQTIGFSFDALNRMTRKDRPGSEPDVDYTYDLRGVQLSASFSGGGGSVVNAFDPVGRLIVSDQTVDGITRRLQYEYDAGGNRTRIVHPDGFSATYDYDQMNRMTRIRENADTPNQVVLATYSYRSQGERASILHGNGTTTSYGYDTLGRLDTLGLDLAGTAYDNQVTFAYNAVGQVVSRSTSNDLYGTDAAPGTTSYALNGLNQIEELNGSSAPDHDANGNMTHDGSRAYAYSSENLLMSGGPATFGYDPLMRLSRVDGSGSQTGWRFTRDGERLVGMHHVGSPDQRLVFGPGPDELVTWFLPSRWFTHTDERGSVIAITDDGGNLVRINRYDEYGRPNANNWGWLMYTGQQWMNDIPIYYYKARFYQPDLGRFLQRDPIGYDDQMNLYVYVGNDPVNMSDPSGLDGCADMGQNTAGGGDQSGLSGRCIDAGAFRADRDGTRTVVSTAEIDESARINMPRLQDDIGPDENIAQFDQQGSDVEFTILRSTQGGDARVSASADSIGSPEAEGHSHPDEVNRRTGARTASIQPGFHGRDRGDHIGVNRGRPVYIVNRGVVIVVERSQGQFRARVISGNPGGSEIRQIGQALNRLQRGSR